MSRGPSSHFLGVHVGRRSLRARLLCGEGTPAALVEKRFGPNGELAEVLHATFAELSQTEAWSLLGGAALALDKGQRCGLSPIELERHLPEGVSLLTLPAHLATLLGAAPAGPSLLVSLGTELRLAAVDGTNTYREFRLQEGGGAWWARELLRLAGHSPKLTRALAGLDSEQKIMRAVPRLLEGADYPAPDPVLRARLEKLCAAIAESCLGLSSRLPGIGSLSFSGYLHPSSMSQRIMAACAAGALRPQQARFPAEVGAALVGLALHKENEERRHLGKPLERGHSLPTGSPPPLLLRRLYRLRRPFERFTARGGDR